MTLACWLYNMDAAPNTDYWGGGEAIFCSEYRVCAILTKHSSLLCGGWPETMLITSSHSHGNTVSVKWQCTKVHVLSIILYNCSWQYLSCSLSRILLSMCYEPQEKILISAANRLIGEVVQSRRRPLLVAAFNQEKALVGAFSVITNLQMELFEALPRTRATSTIKCLHDAAPQCAAINCRK